MGSLAAVPPTANREPPEFPVGYDIVVAITQRSINDQLLALVNNGTIQNSFNIEMGADEQGNWKPILHASFDTIAKDGNGTPFNECIAAKYMPSIDIVQSGTVADLLLSFTGGQAWLRDPVSGNMMKGKNMTGWSYRIAVDLDFAAIERADLDPSNPNKKPVPENVYQSLHSFSNDQFAISQLFLNLDSTALLRGNFPSKPDTKGGSSAVEKLFVLFMSNYLGYISANPKTNPFILGYAITQTPKTVKDNANVPKTLKPVGNTFNLFNDPANPDRSTINFILNTLVSSGTNGSGTHSSPPNFMQNWLWPSENAAAGKMIFSNFSFLDTLILHPFYDSFTQTLHQRLSSAGLDIGADANYAAANTHIDMRHGRQLFVAHDVHDGDDQYWNNYIAKWSMVMDGVSPTPSTIVVFEGVIGFYKEKSKNMICTATAWCSGSINWRYELRLSWVTNAQGQRVLSITAPQGMQIIQPPKFDKGQNTCADAWSSIGGILGGFLDFFTAFQDNNFFNNMFRDLMSPQLSGIQIDLKNINIPSVSAQSVMLPAGDVFQLGDPEWYPDGPLGFPITLIK